MHLLGQESEVRRTLVGAYSHTPIRVELIKGFTRPDTDVGTTSGIISQALTLERPVA